MTNWDLLHFSNGFPVFQNFFSFFCSCFHFFFIFFLNFLHFFSTSTIFEKNFITFVSISCTSRQLFFNFRNNFLLIYQKVSTPLSTFFFQFLPFFWLFCIFFKQFFKFFDVFWLSFFFTSFFLTFDDFFYFPSDRTNYILIFDISCDKISRYKQSESQQDIGSLIVSF